MPGHAIAIVGRPNVGKSTLYNRLVGRKSALVDDRPGVTRDRREGHGHLGDMDFQVIDTAGFEDATDGSLEARMRRQTDAAIAGADICLFMIDARAGVTPLDEQFAALLRKSGKPVIVLANKAEGRAGDGGIADAFGLGLGDPVPLSAEHAEGMGELAVRLQEFIAEDDDGDQVDPDRPLHLAIVGRPNAGKSTLINRLLDDDRLLTGPEAGITRDSIAVDWSWEGRAIRLFDTAGLRRRARVVDKLEKLSVTDAQRAIQFADVVVVLLDATNPFEKQDLHIAGQVAEEGRAVVLAVNKWDLVEDPSETIKVLRERAERLLPQIRGVPFVALSALSGRRLDRLLPAVLKADEVWNSRISTSVLNRWLADAQERHPPPAVQGRRVRLRYITQAKSRPPTFIIFTTRPTALPKSYERYLINGLRDEFDMPGTPIRLYFRKRDNPYVDKK